MQLVNCVEAISHYGFTENELIVWTYSKAREKQLISLLEKYNYKSFFYKITLYTKSSSKGIKSVVSIMRERCFWGKYRICQYDAIIMGNYKLVQEKYFLNRVLHKNRNAKVIIVDDGLAICETAEMRKSEKEQQKMLFDKVSNLYVPVYLGGYLAKWKAPSTIIFFSSYSGITPVFTDTIVLNEHSYISQFINTKKDNFLYHFDVVFLGQPLVQSGILSKEQYSGYINQMINESGRPISRCVYVSHPAENVSLSLNDYLLSNILIKQLDVPIELFLWGVNKKIMVFGFYTSALVNLAQMRLKGIIEVKSIYINEINSIADKNQKRILKDVYEYIGRNGIPIYH